MTLSAEQKTRLLELARAARSQKIPPPETQPHPESKPVESTITISSNPTESQSTILDKYGNLITLNSRQEEFVKVASSGNSAVLIGAAGTGKTTCQRAVVQTLIQSGRAGLLESEGHSHLMSGTPGIVICAFTRRAVANIRRNMPKDLQDNCITIHKLLEYKPVYYEVMTDSGDMKTKMVFEPTRTEKRPLPQSIRTIIFEESSMIGTDLHKLVQNACLHKVQFIYLGDIQQLPPVFGPAILGFKLLELPVVELTEVYRQALESPIISLAHRILSAKPLPVKEFPDWKHEGKMTIRPWKKKIDALNATITLGQVFKQFEDAGIYDPLEDIILIPFNKACGSDELNLYIANHLARKRGKITHQIIAGFNRRHFSVGDKVLYDKEDAEIIDIEKNPAYIGTSYAPASKTLDYWGYDSEASKKNSSEFSTEDDADFILSQVAATEGEKEERVKKSSHTITIRMLDTEQEIVLESAGEVNSLLMGYALTVHKAQGSEWRKVFFCLHQSHATMVQRELLYTAVTRAREELYIICEEESFVRGILSQKVKGNTLAEKAEYFKGKQKQMEEEELEG